MVRIRLSRKLATFGGAQAAYWSGHGFGAVASRSCSGTEWLAPSPGRPDQMWSPVNYDPKLTDPFFESNAWSYPWWIIEKPDGTFDAPEVETKASQKTHLD